MNAMNINASTNESVQRILERARLVSYALNLQSVKELIRVNPDVDVSLDIWPVLSAPDYREIEIRLVSDLDEARRDLDLDISEAATSVTSYYGASWSIEQTTTLMEKQTKEGKVKVILILRADQPLAQEDREFLIGMGKLQVQHSSYQALVC